MALWVAIPLGLVGHREAVYVGAIMGFDEKQADGLGGQVEFWSSVEYGSFLKGLVRELCAHGSSAECAARNAECAQAATFSQARATGAAGRTPGTRLLDTRNAISAPAIGARQCFAVTEVDYRQSRGTVARLLLRWRCYVDYPLQLRRRIRQEEPAAALVVSTNTFYAPWVAMRAARRTGVPVVHWMLDLFPDVLVLASKLRAGSWAERRLRRWVRSMFDGAAANVFLGSRLLAYAEAQFGPIPRAKVIPIGCDAAPFAGRPPLPREEYGPVRLLYCGNFGRMHEVDTIVQSFRVGVSTGVQFDFRGIGPGMIALAAAVREFGLGEQVRLSGGLPEAEWLEAMGAADVALVTMKPGAEGIVMPSKTYSAMAAGQAVLAVCPRESDLADLIIAHDCGWVVEPGDVNGLRAALAEIEQDVGGLLAKRKRAWLAARACYSAEALAHRWAEVFRTVAK